MSNVVFFPHFNGGQIDVIRCGFCGASLHDERDRIAANIRGRPKFFCKPADGGNAQDTCYLSWRKVHH